MRVLIFLFTFFLFRIGLNAQNLTSIPVIKTRAIDLFNKTNLEELDGVKEFRRYLNDTGPLNPSQYGSFGSFPIKLFNNFYVFEENLCYLVKNPKTKTEYINSIRDISTFTFLNDSLLYLKNGDIFSLKWSNYLYDQNKITIIENERNTYEPNVTSRIKHDEYNILKSDILSINIFNSSEGEYLTNLSKNSITNNVSFYGKINNNQSKYILLNNSLINRYNVEEQIYPDGLSNGKVLNYNDSLLVFECDIKNSPSIVDNFYKLNLPYNTVLNIQDSVISVYPSGRKNYINHFWEEEYRYPDGNFIKDDYLVTKYFVNKYNGIDKLNSNSVDFNKFSKIYRNFNLEPSLIVIYDYKNKVTKGIIDRSFLPFNDISKVLFDNSGKYLIIQCKDNYFTIFDLHVFKEVLSLRGIIERIDENNNLFLNSKRFPKESLYDLTKYPFTFSVLKIDLNNLILKNNYYVNNPIKNLSIDEFTSKDQFFNLTTRVRNSEINSFSNQLIKKADKIITSNYINYYVPSHNDIVNNIIQDINNFRNIGKQVKGEYLINLSYSFYDISKKDLHLKVESFDSDLPLNSLLRDYSLYSNIEFKQHNKNTIRLSEITRNYGEDDIIVKFGNVSVELAKEIKDNANKFKLVVRKKIDTKMPFYNKIFFNKFRNELVNDPMYKNNPNKFQFLIPNGTSENNFNSWLLRYEDKDFIFN